jgi:hypothetical protein
MEILMILIISFIVLVVLLWPLKMAAKFVGAKNNSLGRCFVALIIAHVLSAIVLMALPTLLPVAALIDIVMTAFVFSGVLGTSFTKAVVITLVYAVLLVVLFVLIVLIAGVLGVAVPMLSAL